MGVMFGGVLDEEKDEESMESVFYNDLYVLPHLTNALVAMAEKRYRFAYNPQGNGRWMSLNLKKRKKIGGKRRVRKAESVRVGEEVEDDQDVNMEDEGVSN